MSAFDLWLLVALHLVTLASATLALITAWRGLRRSRQTGQQLDAVRDEINGRMDAALLAAGHAGYLRGVAAEQARQSGPQRPAT